MKSSFGVYLVFATILTMEASTLPYVPYSNQPQGYYSPSQWNAPQSDYTDHVQAGYFHQPPHSQDWVSRGYQHSGYEPSMYRPAPIPAMYHHSALGYPMRSPQSTSNTYGSAMSSAIGDSYPQQLLPSQSQPVDVETSDDPSKFKIFHLPLSSSHRAKTLQLPITGEASRFKVVHVNPQGAMSEVEPSRSEDGVSSGALESLTRVKSEIDRIASNSDAYHEIVYSKGNNRSSQPSSSHSEAQATSNSGNGSGKQNGGPNSDKSYLARNYYQGNQGGSYTQLGTSNSDVEANASSSGNQGSGKNSDELYFKNIPSQSFGSPERGYTQRETSNSYAQATASSNSGNLDARYHNSELYPTNTYPQSYNQGRPPTQQKTGYSYSQTAGSSASGTKSPTKVYKGDDVSYMNYPKSYGNQAEGYNNGKPSPINTNNQKYNGNQDVNANNDESYPVNNKNNSQDNVNQDIAPKSDKTYPVKNNDWRGSENQGGSSYNDYPADKNTMQDIGTGDQALNSGESNIPNNSNGQAPINQDESPNSAEINAPNNLQRHLSINRFLKPASSSIAQSSTTAASQNGPTQLQETAPQYRPHQYPNNFRHKRPNYGGHATKHSPNNSQPTGTVATSSSSVAEIPASDKPINNLHIHGGPPIVYPRRPNATQPPNSNKPAHKLTLHGGPPKFQHVSTESPNPNQPTYKMQIRGGPLKFNSRHSHNAPSKQQNGLPNNPLAPVGPTDDSLSDLSNNPLDFSDSSVPIDDDTKPELSLTDETYAPTYDVSSGLSQSVTSLVATNDGASGPADYLPDSRDGSSKNTESAPSDSKGPTYSNPYYDTDDTSGTQPNFSTTSQNAENNGPNLPDWTNSYPEADENIANSEALQDYPNFPLSDSISPFNNPSGTIPTTYEALANVPDALSDDYNGAGSLLLENDSFAPIPTDTDENKNGGSLTSNLSKKTKELSLFNLLTDKTKAKLTPDPISDLPYDVTNTGSYDKNLDNPDTVSSDLGVLLGLDTVNTKDTLSSLQILSLNPDNIGEDDAGNPAGGILSNSLTQVQASKRGVSRTKSITSSSPVASTSSATSEAVENDEYSSYPGPLRVLFKIITTLEKLFGGHE